MQQQQQQQQLLVPDEETLAVAAAAAGEEGGADGSGGLTSCSDDMEEVRPRAPYALALSIYIYIYVALCDACDRVRDLLPQRCASSYRCIGSCTFLHSGSVCVPV